MTFDICVLKWEVDVAEFRGLNEDWDWDGINHFVESSVLWFSLLGRDAEAVCMRGFMVRVGEEL